MAHFQMGNDLLLLAENAARKAGEMLKSQEAKVLSSIGKDVKLDVDMEAHKFLLQKLGATGIPILSEEDGVHEFDKKKQWVIDPLDGSLNFSRGIPISVVSIALMEDGEPKLGVIYDFNRDEMFTGVVGEGAWLNGKPIFVSGVKEKGEAILMSGFPSHSDQSSEALQNFISRVQVFKKVRLFGSAALSLAYVACGRADAYFEKGIYIWDVAAGLALVKAAGGVHTKTSIDKYGKCTTYASSNISLQDEIGDK
ncbi:MAG: inositol monophosphatase family protein [Patescibacteria group bacterium]